MDGLGNLNSVVAGFKALAGIASVVVPFALLSWYTYKMRPKDAYEAAWLAIAWCAVAFIFTK
jgi:hypothetical protein